MAPFDFWAAHFESGKNYSNEPLVNCHERQEIGRLIRAAGRAICECCGRSGEDNDPPPEGEQ